VLIHLVCNNAGLDIPFLLLPYRPTSDPSAVRTFVRHFFDDNYGLRGEGLSQELRMTEPMVSFATVVGHVLLFTNS
jgi:hypothetical protein